MEEKTTENQQLPSEKIQAAFYKLKSDFTLHASVMNEILYIGDQDNQSRAEKQLHRSSSFPGMPIPKYETWRQQCSLNTSVKEIAKLRLLTEKLQKTLQAVHQTTIAAFVSTDFNINELETFLETAIKATDNAEVEIENLKKDYPEWVSKKTGQPRKEISFHIVKILAEEYHRAIGKEPTAAYRNQRVNSDLYGGEIYGDFVDLIKSVFDALDITDSPAAMAKKVLKMRSDRRPVMQASTVKSTD